MNRFTRAPCLGTVMLPWFPPTTTRFKSAAAPPWSGRGGTARAPPQAACDPDAQYFCRPTQPGRTSMQRMVAALRAGEQKRRVCDFKDGGCAKCQSFFLCACVEGRARLLCRAVEVRSQFHLTTSMCSHSRWWTPPAPQTVRMCVRLCVPQVAP